jgi:hypothetical protein
LAPTPFVVRDRDTPRTPTTVEALTTVTPVAEDDRVTEQLPEVPTVVQLVAESEPGPLTMANVIGVPSGAADATVDPENTSTWPVTVWGSPTTLTPSRATEMAAST